MAAGVSFVRHDSDGNIIGYGYGSADLIDKQLVNEGEGCVPASGADVQAVILALANDQPIPFKVDVTGETKVTVTETQEFEHPDTKEIYTADIPTDITYSGVVVAKSADEIATEVAAQAAAVSAVDADVVKAG